MKLNFSVANKITVTFTFKITNHFYFGLLCYSDTFKKRYSGRKCNDFKPIVARFLPY